MTARPWEITDAAHPGVRRVGRGALLVDVPDARTARLLAQWARDGGLGCIDAVPAAATVLFDGVADLDAATRAVATWRAGRVDAAAPGAAERSVTVPVRYDGADLGRVAQLWGVSPDEVVRRHTSIEFTSAFCGFAPGFAYLEGLPPQWAVPRLDVPRARVPLGSVALADSWCGVYPTPSPGGWLLLGTTELPIWDLDAVDGPALLAPGVRVRFEAL